MACHDGCGLLSLCSGAPAGIIVSLATYTKYSPICSTTALPGIIICCVVSVFFTRTVQLMPARNTYPGLGKDSLTIILPVCGFTPLSTRAICPVYSYRLLSGISMVN